MKVSGKVIIVSSIVLALTITILSWFQYQGVKNTIQSQSSSAIKESSDALAQQITSWLTGKLELIDSAAQIIDGDFSQQRIQDAFDVKVLKDNFLIVFGGLDTNGRPISNDSSWNPDGWDARSRPWYSLAKEANKATLTEPYVDFSTNDILISVVSKLTDKGQFKGAFGGDLSLKTISDSLNTLNFNNAGYTFLVAKNGNIISHPNTDNNGKNYSQLFAGQSLSFLKDIQEVEVNGKTTWVSFTPLSGLRGVDWYIGVVVDADIVMSEADHIGISSLIGAIISLVIGVLALSYAMKFILKPIALLTQSLLDINSGSGDLSKRLPIISRDEFAEVAIQFNQFVDNLQGIIINVKALAEDTGNSADVVTERSGKASSELQLQLSELDQLATAMNEMASSASEVANNAQVAAQSASAADNETQNGVLVVSNTTESINALADHLEVAVESVVELTHFSNNIESILSVITEIADQTNLLALNAAIEAARAGESGRGFAVVADEVRSLASRTQESTSEIKSTIEQLQTGVHKAESKIKESREAATMTSKEAAKANESLEVIRNAIVEITDMNIQIASAAEQQSATAEEINRNTTNIRDISQDVSEGAHEQAKQADLMHKQVQAQSEQLNKFKV